MRWPASHTCRSRCVRRTSLRVIRPPLRRHIQRAGFSHDGPRVVASCIRCQPNAGSAFVVSLHHDGLLRAPAPGLLQPGTDHGVHCVSAFREPDRQTSLALWLIRKASPQRGSYPSTNSPRQQPYRITAAVALLRLPHVPLRRPGVPPKRNDEPTWRHPHPDRSQSADAT
jgi:hypothetical protein